MKRFRNKLIAVAAVGIVAVATSLVSSREAVAQNGPSVHIAGPLPLPVRNTDTPPQPIQFSLCVGSAFTLNCGVSPGTYLVPPGKRLVIEYAAGHCAIEAPVQTNAFAGTQTSLGGVSGTYFFPLVPEIQSSGAPLYDWALQTRIYADGGTNVGLFSGSQISALTPLCRATFSGYLTTP
jgi:hypothetical protein